MKVLQSGRQIERRLIIIRRTCRPLRQPFYFGSTRTPDHLILSVLVKFSGVYYSRIPVNGSPEHLSRIPVNWNSARPGVSGARQLCRDTEISHAWRPLYAEK